MSQIGNFSQALVGLASGGAGNFVVRQLSQTEAEEAEETHRVLSNAAVFTLGIAFLLSVSLLIGVPWVGMWLLHTTSYDWVFWLIALSLPLVSLRTLVTSAFNGKGDIGTLTKIAISSQLLVFVLSILLSLLWNLSGVLATVAVGQAFAFFVGFGPFLKRKWLKFPISRGDLRAAHLWSIAKFSLMALTSTLMVPFVLIVVRNLAISNVGLESVGLWDATTRISSVYLSVLTSSLSVYLLPKLSSGKSLDEQRTATFKVLLLVLVVMAVVAVGLLVSARWIIPLLYTEQFLPMTGLLPYQLAGDLFKMVSWVFSFNLLSRGMTRVFIVSEVFFGCLYLVLSAVFLQIWGVVGLPLAHIANYVLYLLFSLFVFRDIVSGIPRKVGRNDH